MRGIGLDERPWPPDQAEPSFQQEIEDALKLVPEGMEGQSVVQGPLRGWCCTSLIGGLRRWWAMRRARAFPSSTEHAKFIRICDSELPREPRPRH